MRTDSVRKLRRRKSIALLCAALFSVVQTFVANTDTAHADPQAPYSGTPHAIPGKIEAEDYDTGGEGVAYHDTTTGNDPGEYRTDDVDIERTYDGGGKTDFFTVPSAQYGNNAGEYVYVKNGERDEFWIIADNGVDTFVRMDPRNGDILGTIDFAPWGNPVKAQFQNGMAYSPSEHKVYVNVKDYSGPGYGMLAIDVPGSLAQSPTIDYTMEYPTTVYNYGGVAGVVQGVNGGQLAVNPVDGTVWLKSGSTYYLFDKERKLFLWAFGNIASEFIPDSYDGAGNMYVSDFPHGSESIPIWMIAKGDTSGDLNDIGYVATQIGNTLPGTNMDFGYKPAYDSNRNVLWITGGDTTSVWPFSLSSHTFGQPITVPVFYSYDYGYDPINDLMYGQIDPLGATGSEVWGFDMAKQEEFVRYMLTGFWTYSGPRSDLYGAGKYTWIDGYLDNNGYTMARLGPGYAVTHTKAGEWLEYTSNVKKAGKYELSIRQSTDSATGKFRLLVDGVDSTGWKSFDSTGATDWKTLDVGTLVLSAGAHVLRLEFDQTNGNDAGNVNWIQLDAVPEWSVTSDSVTATTVGSGLGQAMSADGFSRFAYLDENNHLNYGRCTDKDCTSPVTNVVETDTLSRYYPGSSIITVGQDGFARIIYAKSDHSLWMYTCQNEDCTSVHSNQIADGTNLPGDYGAEVTMGPDGFPRVAYFDGDNGYANHFVRCTDSECANTPADNVIGGTNAWGYAGISLSMGPDGFARIVYAKSDDTVEYVHCHDDVCVNNTVTKTIISDPGNRPGYRGVVVRTGSDGFSRIASQNDSGTIHYVTCSDADCTAPNDATVTQSAVSTNNGFGLTLRVGNLADIAYSDSSDQHLHLLDCTDDTCSDPYDYVVDAAYNDGTDPATAAGVSLVNGNDNFPRALYSDGVNGLRYTRFGATAPIITTSTVTDIASTSATLNATLADDGGETPSVSLRWGTQSGSYPNNCTPVTNSGSTYSCSLTGLTPDTPYYVIASAQNSGGTGTGSEASFTTSKDSSNVTISQISSGFTENGTGLYIGHDGFPRLLFLDENNAVNFLRCTDADCANRVTNVIESDASWNLRPGSSLMTRGSDGFARIVYAKSDESLWVYSCLDDDCSATTSHQIADGTDTPGRYGMEIARGKDGFPRIAYFDGSGTLANHFVRCVDADCSSVVDTVVGGQHPWGMAGISLAMGSDGFARIVYPQNNDTVEFARCADDDCTDPIITTIVNDPGNYPGNYGIVVRMGDDGFARIAYLDQDDVLNYVTCTDADCTASSDVAVTTDAYGSIDGFGLAIRGGNLAGIAYSGNSDGYLHYIGCMNSTCSVSENITVDSDFPEGDFLKGISLVFDGNDPGMLYVDYADVGARFARIVALRGGDVVAPTIVTSTVTDLTPTSATLNATLTSDGGENPTVEIKWGTQSGSYPNDCTPVTNSGSTYSCSLTGLTPDTPYFFIASAQNSGGTGTGSEASFRTPAEKTDKPVHIKDRKCKPQKLSLTLLPNGKVKLSWRKPCDAVDSMEIERKSGTGTFEKIGTVDRDKQTYVDTPSDPSSGEYTYRVRGYRENVGKHSDYSNEKTVTVPRPKTPAPVTQDEPAPTPPEPGRHGSEATLPPVVVQFPPVPQGTTGAFGRFVRDAAALVFPGLVAGADAAASQSAVPLLAVTLAAFAFAGLLAGAAILSASTEVPFFSTSPAPFSEAASKLFGMIGIIGKKKRGDGWGVVFDRETRQPLSGVAVTILHPDGRIADTSVSDAYGHYGFLPDPGTYTLSVSRKGYELEASSPQDILYGDLYVGSPIEIGGSDAVKLNIALRATDIDWQDFARRKIASYTSFFSVLKRDFFLILFYAGFLINAGIAYLFPTVLNIVFFAVYLAMVAYAIFFRKKAYGLVTSVRTGQPVPFTMLSVYDASDPGRRVAFAVSDVLGRYFIFAENGEYLLRVSGRFLGGENFEKTFRVKVDDGVVRSDVGI